MKYFVTGATGFVGGVLARQLRAAEGVRTKLFKCDDPGLTTRALLGIMNWTITWYRPDGEKSVEQIADNYSKLLLNGLLK